MPRATIRTTHDRPDLVADAVAPDNTDEIATWVEGDQVVTTIERASAGGFRSTVDDYVTNIAVADTLTRQ